MKIRQAGLAVAGLFVMLGSVLAQNDISLDAGRKIRGDDQEGHYALMHQRHARDYVHTLYYHANSETGVNPAQAQRYMAEVKKNLESSSKALKNLQTSNAKDPQVKTAIAKIEAHHTKVLKDCDMVNAECQKPKADNIKISDGCVDIARELNAAQTETGDLLKHLKLDQLPTLRKSTDKPAAK